MFVASYSRTMANARQIVVERPRRAKLIETARRWQEMADRKKAADEARREVIRRAVEAERRRTEGAVRALVAARKGPEAIIDMVASWHGVSSQDILGPSRSHPVLAARYDAILAVYDNCRMDGKKPSTLALGRLFNRDHSSIINALDRLGVSRAAMIVMRPEQTGEAR